MSLPLVDHRKKPWSRDQRDYNESTKRSEPAQRLSSEKGSPLDAQRGLQCYTCG